MDSPGTIDTTGDNTGGSGNRPAWMEQLPDDLKGNEALTGFQTIGDLGKSYLDLRGKLENSIQLPGDDADDAAKDAFYNKLGRPETPDGYQFQRPELPEGAVYDEQMEADFRQHAHQLGLTQAQAEGAYNYFIGQILEATNTLNEQAEAQRVQAIEKLQQSWGGDFEKNCEIATRTFLHFADDEAKQFFVDSKLGDNPLVIRLFHEIGKQMLNDEAIFGKVTPPGNENQQGIVKRGIDGRPLLSYPSMGD
jgi:hypothetical protein